MFNPTSRSCLMNNTILGPSMGYIEMLNAFTQEVSEDKDKEFAKYNPLRPSSAGKCTRELGNEFARYRGYKEYRKTPNTPETHRLLNFGNPIENHLISEMRDAFKKAPVPVSIKYRQQTLSFFRLGDGTLIEGNIDLTLISEKFKCVIDIKSKKDKFSAWYKTSWEELSDKMFKMKSVQRFGEETYWVEDLDAFILELNDAFFAANFYQLNMYFFDEGKFLRERGVDHAAIIQYNKNDSRIREIRFKPSQSLYDRVKSKFLSVQEVVDRDKNADALPQDYALGSAKCAFCDFNKDCYPEDNALKLHFKTYPHKRWSKDLDRLPQKDAQALDALFDKYVDLSSKASELDSLELQIVQIMNKVKVNKIKLEDGKVYEVKRLKSGGVAGGPREVIRRSKD